MAPIIGGLKTDVTKILDNVYNAVTGLTNQWADVQQSMTINNTTESQETSHQAAQAGAQSSSNVRHDHKTLINCIHCRSVSYVPLTTTSATVPATITGSLDANEQKRYRCASTVSPSVSLMTTGITKAAQKPRTLAPCAPTTPIVLAANTTMKLSALQSRPLATDELVR